jgi:hypothetical protein
MAALTSTIPTVAGVATPGAAVSASDTVTQAQLGSRGAFLEIVNGSASTDTMTVTDAGGTPAGNLLSGGTYTPGTIPNATNKIFYLDPSLANLTTGLVTITHTQVTTVTYKLYPLG